MTLGVCESVFAHLTHMIVGFSFWETLVVEHGCTRPSTEVVRTKFSLAISLFKILGTVLT